MLTIRNRYLTTFALEGLFRHLLDNPYSTLQDLSDRFGAPAVGRVKTFVKDGVVSEFAGRTQLGRDILLYAITPNVPYAEAFPVSSSGRLGPFERRITPALPEMPAFVPEPAPRPGRSSTYFGLSEPASHGYIRHSIQNFQGQPFSMTELAAHSGYSPIVVRAALKAFLVKGEITQLPELQRTGRGRPAKLYVAAATAPETQPPAPSDPVPA